MLLIKQSEATAARRRVPLHLVSGTDGLTALTGQTGAGRLSKGGGVSAATTNSLVEVDATNMPGLYYLELTAAEVDTLGVLFVRYKSAGSAEYQIAVLVVALDPFDAAALGLSRLDAAVSTRSSHTAADVWAVATRALTDKAGFSLSAAGVQAVWDALTSALTTDGSVGKRIAGTLDANISSRPAASDYTAARAAKLDNLDAAISTRSTLTAANVWDYLASNATTAGSLGKRLADNLDATVSGVAAAVWAAGSRTLTGAVDLSATALAAVWDRATSALTTAGSIGKRLADDVDATISSRSSHTPADVWTSATRTLTSGAAPSAGTIAAAVWDEPAGNHTVAGSTGQRLNAAGGAADPLGNAVPGSYAAGTAGYALGRMAAGTGAIAFTYTVYQPDGVTPIDGAEVQVYTDSAMTARVAGPVYTDSAGRVTVYLAAGTYYVRRSHAAWQFANPDTEVVS